MCFDGVARVSRAAAQLAFFVAVALDVYQGKAIWNVYIDSLFLNALPVPMLATGFFEGQNGAKTLQDAPRLAKTRQDAPRCAQEGPKTAQDASKMPQDVPKRRQDAPGLGKWSQNGAKLAPKSFQMEGYFRKSQNLLDRVLAAAGA